MSQRDLVAELRASRVAAPSEVRERVRLIAARDTTPVPRRFTWRRAGVVLVPLAAAIAATIVVTRPSHEPQAVPSTQTLVERSAAAQGAPTASAKTFAAPHAALTPAPSRTRVQRYGAYLALRVPTPDGVSAAVKRAVRIAGSLGGYVSSVHASAHAKTASADLVLKVARGRVQDALTRFSQLGTITGEQVDVQDLQTGVNATGRTIARLQKELAELRAQPPSPALTRRIAALVARVESLQRDEAATIRAARFATIQLHLATPQPPAKHHHGHGPLHGLLVALTWLGIGAIYVLVLGLPVLVVVALGVLLARLIRRRREDALLSRP